MLTPSDTVDRVHKGADVEVRIDLLSERHGTGMAYDLLDHGLVNMGFCQHGDASVAGAVRRLRVPQLIHQRDEVAVVVVPVIEMFLIRRMQ